MFLVHLCRLRVPRQWGESALKTSRLPGARALTLGKIVVVPLPQLGAGDNRPIRSKAARGAGDSPEASGDRPRRRHPGAGNSGRVLGALARTVDGIEAALTWGPTAGRGKGARLLDYLKPVRKGGRGPEIFIPLAQRPALGWRTRTGR